MFRKTCFLLVAISLFAPRTAQCEDSPLTVTVSELLNQVQRGINIAKTTIDNDYKNVPPLDSVTLQLQTETETSGTAGVNLWFVKIGGGASKTSTSQMTLVLKPATARSPVANEKLDQTISQALIGVAKGIHDAQIGQSGIPLLADSLTADFAFTVKRNGNVGIQFTIVPVGGNAQVSRSGDSVQRITVKFAKPPDKPSIQAR